ncbi:hypothetical protein [Pendulispora albinea]|uniref:Uncharacterized protein n=1 Tax=Pendulispora albinea TaxID=2741071 RepID=A0ABZ2LX34_9BACT
MFIAKLLVPFALAAAILAVPTVANAENTLTGATQSATAASSLSARLDALRQGERELDARAKAIRVRMEKAEPRLRRHSKRILVTVEETQVSIATRLDILQTTTTEMEEASIQNMEKMYKEAIKLLQRVESWYQPPANKRRTP